MLARNTCQRNGGIELYRRRVSADFMAGRIRQFQSMEVQLMNWDIVKGNWKQFRGTVKAQWGKLTDDHLDVIQGNREQLAGKIQEQYGWTKEETENQLRKFEEKYKEYNTTSTL